MTSFMQRSARYWLIRKATKEIIKEIETAGIEDLKALAAAGISIIDTYLQGCSPEEKARHKQDLSVLIQLGVTPDMILEELTLQMTELAPIIKERPDYKKREIQNLERFLKEG